MRIVANFVSVKLTFAMADQYKGVHTYTGKEVSSPTSPKAFYALPVSPTRRKIMTQKYAGSTAVARSDSGNSKSLQEYLAMPEKTDHVIEKSFSITENEIEQERKAVLESLKPKTKRLQNWVCAPPMDDESNCSSHESEDLAFAPFKLEELRKVSSIPRQEPEDPFFPKESHKAYVERRQKQHQAEKCRSNFIKEAQKPRAIGEVDSEPILSKKDQTKAFWTEKMTKDQNGNYSQSQVRHSSGEVDRDSIFDHKDSIKAFWTQRSAEEQKRQHNPAKNNLHQSYEHAKLQTTGKSEVDGMFHATPIRDKKSATTTATNGHQTNLTENRTNTNHFTNGVENSPTATIEVRTTPATNGMHRVNATRNTSSVHGFKTSPVMNKDNVFIIIKSKNNVPEDFRSDVQVQKARQLFEISPQSTNGHNSPTSLYSPAPPLIMNGPPLSPPPEIPFSSFALSPPSSPPPQVPPSPPSVNGKTYRQPFEKGARSQFIYQQYRPKEEAFADLNITNSSSINGNGCSSINGNGVGIEHFRAINVTAAPKKSERERLRKELGNDPYMGNGCTGNSRNEVSPVNMEQIRREYGVVARVSPEEEAKLYKAICIEDDHLKMARTLTTVYKSGAQKKNPLHTPPPVLTR